MINFPKLVAAKYLRLSIRCLKSKFPLIGTKMPYSF